MDISIALISVVNAYMAISERCKERIARFKQHAVGHVVRHEARILIVQCLPVHMAFGKSSIPVVEFAPQFIENSSRRIIDLRCDQLLCAAREDHYERREKKSSHRSNLHARFSRASLSAPIPFQIKKGYL